MILVIDFSDPTFYNEVNALRAELLVAKLSYSMLLNEILLCLPEREIQTSTFQALIDFEHLGFDDRNLNQHSISFFEVEAGNAKMILNEIEKWRFKLRLMDSDQFESLYEIVMLFLDKLIAIQEKVNAIKDAQNNELNFLNN